MLLAHMKNHSKKPYEDRSDIEKIKSQWHKLSGLHSREESSAAIVRAATAAELAANYAIRQEFSRKSNLSAAFVNSQLKIANGLNGKIDKLLLNLTFGEKHHAIIKKLKKHSQHISELRNSIVHQGDFSSATEAKDTINESKNFIESLVQIYDPDFVLIYRG